MPRCVRGQGGSHRVLEKRRAQSFDGRTTVHGDQMRPCRLVKLVALVVCVPSMARSQTESPSTRRAREVVAAINAATPATLRAFVDSALDDQMRRMPMRAHIDFFMGQ